MDPQSFLATDTLHWIAPTHVKSARTTDWYWALGIIAVFGTVASVLWGNILFAGIIALGAISIIIMAVREPREFEVTLMPDGIHIDHDFYGYDALHSFWVTHHRRVPKLMLATRGLIHPHIAIPLTGETDPEYIRAYLLQFIPEEPGHSFGSWFIEFLGF